MNINMTDDNIPNHSRYAQHLSACVSSQRDPIQWRRINHQAGPIIAKACANNLLKVHA